MKKLDNAGCSCNTILNRICDFHLMAFGVPFELNPETLEVTFPGFEKQQGS